MRFNKNIAFAVTTLATMALTGLGCLQMYLMSRTFIFEAQVFRQNVNAALNSIVQKLETQETVAMVIKTTFGGADADSNKIERVRLMSSEEPPWMVREQKMSPEVHIDSNKIVYRLPIPQQVRISTLDSTGVEINEIYDQHKPAGQHRFVLRDSLFSEGVSYFQIKIDNAHFVFQTKRVTNKVLLKVSAVNQNKRFMVERVLEEISSHPKKPIHQRINYASLDSLIGVTFQERGLTLPYAYGILSSDSDSVVLAEPVTMKEKLHASEYKSQLFPHDIFIDDNKLVVVFPGQALYLLRQVGLSAVIAMLFVATLVCCFVYVIRTVIKQKEFSNLLVDFINNMTHEFKTPLSTISLASEALAAPRVIKDKARVMRYGKIIQDESGRMRTQVETILQMAAMEKGEVELTVAHVDVHALIADAAEHFSLAIEKRDGSLTTQLSARNHIIEADVVHVGNIIHNLLDNAVKYTREYPEIKIATADAEGKIKITVRDNGIGLRADEQRRVFDAYYRVPAGNIHEVKGFGLGLSYVKRMVQAHGGSVTVESAEGEGSTFAVFLPVKQK